MTDLSGAAGVAFTDNLTDFTVDRMILCRVWTSYVNVGSLTSNSNSGRE